MVWGQWQLEDALEMLVAGTRTQAAAAGQPWQPNVSRIDYAPLLSSLSWCVLAVL